MTALSRNFDWLVGLLTWAWLVVSNLYDLSYGLQLLFSCICLFSLWRAIAARTGIWHPAAIYVPISGLYVLAPLAEVVLFGNALGLDGERMSLLACLGVTFILFAALGFATLAKPRIAISVGFHKELGVRCALGVVCILTATCVLLTMSRYGFAIGTMTRAELYADEFVLLSFLRNILVIIFGIASAFIAAHELVIGAKALGKRMVLFSALAVYLASDLLLLGDRRLALVAVISTGGMLLPKRVSLRQSVIAASAIVILVLFGFIRNTPPQEWLSTLSGDSVLANLSPAAQEFGGLGVIGGAIDNLWNIPADFPRYSDAFEQIMPRVFADSRPLAPTEWFVWNYFPALAKIGASFAFNSVIEALANGGIPGIIFVGFLTGAAIAMVCRLHWQQAAVGLPLAAYIFTFSMRMDFASQLRTATLAVLGLGILMFVVFVGSLFQNARQGA